MNTNGKGIMLRDKSDKNDLNHQININNNLITTQ